MVEWLMLVINDMIGRIMENLPIAEELRLHHHSGLLSA